MFWTVQEGDPAIAFGVQRAHGPLVIGDGEPQALSLLAAAIARRDSGLTGVLGSRAACEAFAGAWREHTPAARIREGKRWIWTDRRPRALVGFVRLDATTGRIVTVYASPNCRGRGYARALTAAVGDPQWLGAAHRRDEVPPSSLRSPPPEGDPQWLGAAHRHWDETAPELASLASPRAGSPMARGGH